MSPPKDAAPAGSGRQVPNQCWFLALVHFATSTGAPFRVDPEGSVRHSEFFCRTYSFVPLCDHTWLEAPVHGSTTCIVALPPGPGSVRHWPRTISSPLAGWLNISAGPFRH